MQKEIKLSFQGSMYSVLPRMVWQILYNIYSEAGCELKNLDNLLIDYDNCKKLFDNLNIGEEVKFIFGCEPRHFMTTWIPQNQYWDDLQAMIEWSSYDVVYEVTINDNEAMFTRMK